MKNSEFINKGNELKRDTSPNHLADSLASLTNSNNFNLKNFITPKKGVSNSLHKKNSRRLRKGYSIVDKTEKGLFKIRYEINETNFNIEYDSEEIDSLSSSDPHDNFWGSVNTERTQGSKLMEIYSGLDGKSSIEHHKMSPYRKIVDYKN